MLLGKEVELKLKPTLPSSKAVEATAPLTRAHLLGISHILSHALFSYCDEFSDPSHLREKDLF